MKTEIKAIAPTDAGLSLAVLSGPRGSVLEDWPCIEYTCQLSDSRKRVIWTGDFRLGVGHVKWPSLAAVENYNFHTVTWGLNSDEMDAARIHARGQTVKQTPGGMATEASAAAKLAKKQKVAPKLEDVCHSLLSEGAAFFDGQRFEDWAADYGYSDDSIKAKETFDACDKIGRDLSRALSRDEITGLREWASNY